MKLHQLAAGVAALAISAGTASAQVFINEIYASHSGTDTEEYFELKGPMGTLLDNHMFLVVEGDTNSTGLGALDRAYDLSGLTIPASGFFVGGNASVTPNDLNIGVSNSLENGSQTYYLVDAGSPAGVAGISALIGTDVTTPPASGSSVTLIPGLATVLDLIAVDNGVIVPGPSTPYDGALVIGPDLVCCVPFTAAPAGYFRDQDAPNAWCFNDWLDFDPNANLNRPRTPGAANSACTAGTSIFFCDLSDNSLASCPCANPGSATTGCDNAQATGGVGMALVNQTTSPNGATLSGTGFSTMGAPTAIVIRSNALDPSSPVVFGDGLRCVSTFPLVRLAATTALAGTSTHVIGHSVMAGAGSFYYQIWYRNTPSTFCDAFAAFNLSSGIRLEW